MEGLLAYIYSKRKKNQYKANSKNKSLKYNLSVKSTYLDKNAKILQFSQKYQYNITKNPSGPSSQLLYILLL